MPKFAKRIETMNSEVDKLMVLINSLVNGNVISFGGGAPALEAYPMEQLNEIAQAVFQRTPAGYGAFKYGSAMGNEDLRKAVRDILLAPRGLKADIGNIMITAGGIQPITFMSQLYLDPGDVVLVEAPSFVQTSMIFKMFEAKLVPCEMADDGLVMEDVEEKIKKYNPKFIYTVPTFQNPTGITMSLEKRKRLAELASQYDVIVLEDDPYREIRYSGEELPYIKSFDTTGNVVLAVRPENITMSLNGGYMKGIVTEKFYLGDSIDYRVQVGESSVRVIDKGAELDAIPSNSEVYLDFDKVMVFDKD